MSVQHSEDLTYKSRTVQFVLLLITQIIQCVFHSQNLIVQRIYAVYEYCNVMPSFFRRDLITNQYQPAQELTDEIFLVITSPPVTI